MAPRTYTEQRGGHLGMIRHHLGRQPNETQRRRWLELLMQTADDVGLPADPEFRARSALGLGPAAVVPPADSDGFG